ncbi:hypothetical protein P3G55_11335 [Leptospira sp. 96542]|nr:hypothetical protein [Leptospira sp. 96542]
MRYLVFTFLILIHCKNLRIVTSDDPRLVTKPNNLLYFEEIPFTGVLVTEDKNLLITHQTEYQKGIPHGKYTAKHSINGIVLEERSFYYGQKDGLHKSYFPNGKLRLLSEYKNGQYQNERFEYYEDGTPSLYAKYYESGMVKQTKQWNRKGQIYSNQVYTEEGDVFGKPGSKNCLPIDF